MNTERVDGVESVIHYQSGQEHFVWTDLRLSLTDNGNAYRATFRGEVLAGVDARDVWPLIRSAMIDRTGFGSSTVVEDQFDFDGRLASGYALIAKGAA